VLRTLLDTGIEKRLKHALFVKPPSDEADPVFPFLVWPAERGQAEHRYTHRILNYDYSGAVESAKNKVWSVCCQGDPSAVSKSSRTPCEALDENGRAGGRATLGRTIAQIRRAGVSMGACDALRHTPSTITCSWRHGRRAGGADRTCLHEVPARVRAECEHALRAEDLGAAALLRFVVPQPEPKPALDCTRATLSRALQCLKGRTVHGARCTLQRRALHAARAAHELGTERACARMRAACALCTRRVWRYDGTATRLRSAPPLPRTGSRPHGPAAHAMPRRRSTARPAPEGH
jgi:hypothetical protein